MGTFDINEHVRVSVQVDLVRPMHDTRRLAEFTDVYETLDEAHHHEQQRMADEGASLLENLISNAIEALRHDVADAEEQVELARLALRRIVGHG